MTTPPHARIAADIKRRVAEGRLRPGDRVPSTRQLARDWNVALATAAKALTLLAREGVVVAEPRVGTVVARGRGQKARPAASSEHDLTRQRVVRAAVELADADGLAELTMRALADRLGVATMSLYRHVGGKDDLVVLMVDAGIAEFALPGGQPDDWRTGLETIARLQWAAYRAHPWMAGLSSITRPVPSPALLRHTEWAMRALAGSGLDAETRMYVQITLYGYVQGVAANIEKERRAQAATGVTADEWMDEQGDELRWIGESRNYPAFVQLLDDLGEFDLDLDRLFEFGLGALLDGLTPMIEHGRGGNRR
ncbi:TetR family transcriptional regulator [Nonomuraea fuscirosea]|uniref:TetR family transcriptional regulator n=1 Tax=Nonomuraea fuscirosea TaxID=1291556 RepID=A0A2T0MWC3_9ACTN|nr:TetR/AcrR family transcriptional regulator C-terminal domain-containing protein [Nonomuraea fuscirosea]PRX63249.1 TetR family transcriptional regulator [Nonomuraea fuscirosea]